MKRILAVSDIHGEVAKLERILEEAGYNPQYDQLILLGDYIDRGSATYHSYEGDIDLMIEHINWLRKNLSLYYETEHYIFVHAGLEPETPLEWQEEEVMLWMHNYDSINLGKLVVHGHTPVDEVEQIEDQLFIDTGASVGGKLSLVVFPSMLVYEE